MRYYLLYSIITALGFGIPFALFFAFKWNDTSLKVIAIRIVIMAASLFVITFAAFLIAGTIAKRREKKLAEQDFEEDDEEDV